MKPANWIIGKISQWLSKDLIAPNANLVDFEALSYEIRPADVLLVEGQNHISRIIRQITSSPWTHSALYIGRLHDIDDPQLRAQIQKHYHGPPNNQLLIESLLDKGTVITSLSRYKNHHIRICRPAGLTRPDAQAIIEYAASHLGRDYSIRHVLDLARFLFPYAILPRRWRSSIFTYNIRKPTENICSSLLAEAFTSVSFPILPIIRQNEEKHTFELIKRNPRIYVPSDFDYSPYFSIIKYPFINLSSAKYRNLPWDKNRIALDQNEKNDIDNKIIEEA